MKYNKLFTIILFFLAIACFSQKEGEKAKDPNQKEKKVRIVAIPLVNYSNSFGGSFGAIGSGYYKFNSQDSISPLSSSTIIGTYSTNKTWFTGQMNKFYLKEDKLRIKTALGMGNINFQTYVGWPSYIDLVPIVVESNASDGTFIDYSTKMQFAFVEGLSKIVDNFYLGGRMVYSHSTTTFELESIPEEELSQFGFGISTELDTRDSQFSPTTGNHANFKTMSFLENLGSTNSYTKMNVVYNHYFPMNERNTILARFYSDVSVGDVPFAGQNVVGKDDLRGYSNGKYRGDQVYAAQSEYRHWLSEKWGYVAFGGVATAIDSSKDLNFENVLPAVGVGVRFLAIPKANISIGIDVAVGKDDWGLYFRIGEAFTR